MFADATRLWLLLILSEGEANAAELCTRMRRPQPSVSHHLGILRRAGLLLDRREGKTVVYRLAEPPAGNGAIRVSRDGVTITVAPTGEKSEW